jgi:rubrerythrin
LGGQPAWSIEPFPEHIDPIEILQVQLEKERLALKLYQEANDLVPPTSPLRKTTSSMARAEEFHISAVEGVLHKLKN